MHLIMNALEEVTSRAHPNVSEISLLITLVSASAGFKPAGKKKNPDQIKEPRLAYYCARHSSSAPVVFAASRFFSWQLWIVCEHLAAPCCIPTLVIWMENNASAALYPSGHT